MKKFFYVLLIIVFVVSMPFKNVEASQSVVKTQPLSPGVTWNKYNFNTTNKHEINHVSVDLTNPYAMIDIGLPLTYGGKAKTTSLATLNSNENSHRVVGAINAAYYHMNNGFPIYLIAKDNAIYNSGIISKSNDAFVNKPIAFGITADGNAEIDTFTPQYSATLPTRTMVVDGVNRQREIDEMVLYTPQHHSPYTLTNEFGVEYIFQSDLPITSTEFGQTLTGKVVGIYPYGSKGKRLIPKNGFALSAAQSKVMNLQSLNLGEEVTIKLGIDSKWQDSKFIMASGPMLVQDGKRNLSMNSSSSKAKEVTARSAIAISKDKKQAHFITVDSTSSSKGMNLMQFADYIASLGFDRALNLDGGGSTTMGYRPYGTHQIALANRPSAGSERAVSAILQAVSTAPLSIPKHLNFSVSTKNDTLLVGAESNVAVNYVLDEFYNPLPVANVNLKAAGNGVTINGLKIVSTQAGTETIQINHGETNLNSFTINVVEAPTTLTVAPTSIKVQPGQQITLQAKAMDANSLPLVFNPSQLRWSVPTELGSITSNGVFKADAAGNKKGNIEVTLGTKTVTIPVEIEQKISYQFTDVSANYLYAKELNYLVENKIINGFGDDTFRPVDSLSREHAMVILSRLLKLDTTTVTDPGFSDVPKTHLYYKEIASVANAGIISGKDGGKYFAPNDTITRAQMAKVLVEAFKLEGTTTKPFTDIKTTDWAYNYIQALVANNVSNGYTDGTFRPNESIQRIHFGIFIYNLKN
ncbi:S-layer homology domain-containing protein [Sporosarcina sp. FA9]|uniref:S-layer homology domain-containing protein n=1 Tax=Sporosarcina sp. FA9 TaxID=3413030 RepID=UPI003F654EA7